jgi:hypothetical protein
VKWVSIATACCVTVSQAHADEASDLAAAGEKRAKAGDFAGAAERYLRAYRADDKPDYLCEVGLAYRKAQDELPRAHLYLGRCLGYATALDPDRIASLRAALRAVERDLVAGDFIPIEIIATPSTAEITISAFEPQDMFTGMRVVWLPRGKHQITASAPGYVDHTVKIEAREKTTVRIRPPRLDVEQLRSDPIVYDSPSKIPAIAATVIAVAGGGFGIYAYGKAQDAAEPVPFAATRDIYDAEAKRVRRWNAGIIVGAGVAGFGAVVSGYLWYRALRSSTRVEVTADGDGATVWLTL